MEVIIVFEDNLNVVVKNVWWGKKIIVILLVFKYDGCWMSKVVFFWMFVSWVGLLVIFDKLSVISGLMW